MLVKMHVYQQLNKGWKKEVGLREVRFNSSGLAKSTRLGCVFLLCTKARVFLDFKRLSTRSEGVEEG